MADMKTCPTCKGKGEMKTKWIPGKGYAPELCKTCGGSGWVPDKK